MHHEIRVMTLGLLIGSWTVNEIGSKISENRDLLCAKPAGERRSLSQVVLVGRQDHDRWCGATEELVAKIHALQEKETAASLHRNPPFHDRLLWRVRHAARNWVLRSNYDAAVAELRAEFNAALSAYLERAGDLPSYLEERKRRELERRRRQVEEDKRERAEAMARAKGPVWAYWLSERNSFWIYLADLDHHGEGARTGLTAEQVQELAQELFRPDRLSLALLGPYTDPKPFSTLLESL